MKRQSGFTLIELLVVIAVIGVLAAVLYPIFAHSNVVPRRISCTSNMRQVGTGLGMYTQDYDETYPNYRFLPLGSQHAGDFEKNSWKSALYPYIKNREVFVCKGNPSKELPSYDPLYKISYAANVALNPRNYPTHKPAPPIPRNAKGSGIFGNELSTGVKTSDVAAPAECIAILEIAYIPQNSFCVDIADDYSIAGSSGQTVRVFSDTLFTGHSGKSNYLLADGHVKNLKPSQTNQDANFWYRDGSPLSAEGKLTLQNAEANAH